MFSINVRTQLYVRQCMIISDGRIHAQVNFTGYNRRADDNKLTCRLLVRCFVLGRVFQLDLYTTERHTEMAVLVGWGFSSSIIVNVRLRNSSGYLGSGQSVYNSCFGEDAQVGKVFRTKWWCVEALSFRHKDQAQLPRCCANSGPLRRIELCEKIIGGEAASGQHTRLKIVGQLLWATRQ
jgi:hypothetical protein